MTTPRRLPAATVPQRTGRGKGRSEEEGCRWQIIQQGRAWAGLSCTASHFTEHVSPWYLKSSNMCKWVGGGVAKKVVAWVLHRTLCEVFFPFWVSRAEKTWILNSPWGLDLPEPLNISKCENSRMRSQEEYSNTLGALPHEVTHWHTWPEWLSPVPCSQGQRYLPFTFNSQTFPVLPEPVQGSTPCR